MTRIALAVVLVLLVAVPLATAADLDRTAVDFTAPGDIKWVRNLKGSNEVPVPAGSYVVHYANKVHYDGAKDEETIIQVWGIGPATSTPAGRR